MTKSNWIAYAGITLVMVIWGLSFLSIKVTVGILAPMSLALSRFIIASLILVTILKFREPYTRLNKKDIPLMVFSGVIGITIYFFFENTGVKLTIASTASIIIGTIPMLTVVADWLICGNRISWSKGLGVMMSFTGVYLIVVGSGQFSIGSEDFMGNLLMLGAAVSWVAYSLATRPLNERYSRLAITTYQTLFGTIAIVPFVFFENNLWHVVDGFVVANILFMGIFCSALGYYVYVYSLSRIGVGVTSLFVNLIPVVTVVSSYFLLGEKITSIQLVGGGIVIAALYVAELGSRFGRGTGKNKPTLQHSINHHSSS